MLNSRKRSIIRKYLNESYDSYISILVDEAQFYISSDDDFFDDEMIKDSVKFRKFKRECQKFFGKECIKEYGAGQLEIIITESQFRRFEILANSYGVDFEVDDIIEM